MLDRFISIICTETVQIAGSSDRSRAGRTATATVSRAERLERRGRQGREEFRVERTLQSVNGRPAGRNPETECPDPKTGTPEP